MLLPSVLLFVLFLLLSAFFSASETAFVAANPITLDMLEKKGSKRAKAVKRLLARVEHLLGTILIGNTLVNVSAASVATTVFVSLIPDRNKAVLLSTICTTLLLLFFSEFNPKILAASNPIKFSFLLVYPLRVFVLLLYPFIQAFAFLSKLLFRSSRDRKFELRKALSEEETKVLLESGIKGLSTARRKMIAEILDIGTRPIKEVMTPRPQVKAIEVEASFEQVLEIIRAEGYSRYPVYKSRMDNIEGLLFAKDIIPYLQDHQTFVLRALLRKPFFVPESASLERVLLQMQEHAVHLAFIVDEFGNLEGIVTLEDIIEEIVGEIQDEHDEAIEDWQTRLAENVFLLKGQAAVKDINDRFALSIPERSDYTTLAGFLLAKLGRIPHEKDELAFHGHTFIVEKMSKRHISLVRLALGSATPVKDHENRRRQ